MKDQDRDTPDLADVLRRRVRQLRADRGLSAQALVDAMHRYGAQTTRSSLANFENGQRADISFAEAVAMALVLEVPLSALIAAGSDRGSVRVGEQAYDAAELLNRLSGVTLPRVTVQVDIDPDDPARVIARVITEEEQN